MSKVDVSKIKQLREETSAGVMEVKKALEETSGDLNTARELLQEWGLSKAAAKSDRKAAAGLIDSYIHSQSQVGVLIEVNCETDFVARTDMFKELVHHLCLQIAAMQPSSVEDLLEQEFVKDTSQKIGDIVKSVIASTGENIVIKRFTRYALNDNS